jgi:hypothetical protein
MTRRLSRLALSAALGAAAVFAFAGSADAATLSVSCGDTAGLVSAITSANSTTDADTIDVTGAPCANGFVLTSAASPAAGNDTGLPTVVSPLTIQGHGATIQRAQNAPAFRMVFANGAPLDLRDLTIAFGKLTGTNFVGAGVAGLNSTLSLDNVLLYANQSAAGGGGGLYAQGGSASVERSTFEFNIASSGAGIYDVASPIAVRHSLLFENVATNANHNASTGGALITGAPATFQNDTLALNAANNGIGGIAVANSGTRQGTATIDSATFADNGNNTTAGTPPGGAIFTCAAACGGSAAAPVVHLHSSIVTDTDSTAAAVLKPCDSDFGGSIVDDGGNLEWPGSTCPAAARADPELATIALNGGPTYNYRLLPGSPATDLGAGACPADDQRGKARPGGDGCDAGSFETHPPQTTATGDSGPRPAPQVTFSSDRADAGFECRVDGGAWSACTSPFTLTGVPDGTHSVDVRANAIDPTATTNTDNATYADPSPAQVSVTVDATPPVVTIGSVPSPTTDSTPDVPFTVDDPTATTTCQVDSGVETACASPFTPPVLPDGPHTITVRATDPAGNTGSAQVSVYVAANPPDTAITAGPSGTVLGTKPTYSATFQFSATPAYGATFECQLDAAPWAACTSPTSATVAPGAHTFNVRAIGPAGLVDPSPASRSFTYKKCTLLVGTLCIL